MLSFRYPSFTLKELTDILIQYKLDPIDPTSATPLPSMSGFAFAQCAASLPLLKSRDNNLANTVLALIKSTAPFILEPWLVKKLLPKTFRHPARSDDTLHSSEYPFTADELYNQVVDEAMKLSKGRLQHLLNRIEQVSYMKLILECNQI
jgi:hypothetical protein